MSKKHNRKWRKRHQKWLQERNQNQQFKPNHPTIGLAQAKIPDKPVNQQKTGQEDRQLEDTKQSKIMQRDVFKSLLLSGCIVAILVILSIMESKSQFLTKIVQKLF